MFTTGIHVKDIRRATSVLQYNRSNPFNYDYYKQDKDFYIFEFPGVDYETFKSIILLLKRNGITTIGADEQLSERNIMKLTNLLEQNKKNQLNRMETAEDVIEEVDEIITDNPDTALDLLSDMIEDFYENQSIDKPDVSLQEQKLSKLIKILVKEWHEQN
tara:strand:- start:254 stop:733 length:480 start_codon:yes stop_codon:yes gene_type:complete